MTDLALTLLLALALAGPGRTAAAATAEPAAPPWPSVRDDHQPMVAEVAKKKKKKRKKKDDDSFGPDDVGDKDDGTGVSVHREQVGVDHPYVNELDGSTVIQFTTTTPQGGDASNSTAVDIAGEFFFILGHLEVGPELDYSTATTTTTVTTTDPTTKATSTAAVDSKSQTFAVGPVIKWNFGDIDHATMVPFVYAGVAYRGGTSQAAGGSTANTTGSHIRFGGGLNLFLSSGVAFQPKIEYRLQSDKSDADGAKAVTTSGIKIILGISSFI